MTKDLVASLNQVSKDWEYVVFFKKGLMNKYPDNVVGVNTYNGGHQALFNFGEGFFDEKKDFLAVETMPIKTDPIIGEKYVFYFVDEDGSKGGHIGTYYKRGSKTDFLFYFDRDEDSNNLAIVYRENIHVFDAKVCKTKVMHSTLFNTLVRSIKTLFKKEE